MKKYLIPNEGKFYKANLHMHTTMSDGRETPEEVKAAYKAAGYSVVAFTDHEIMLDHSDLADEDFLPITSFEKSINAVSPATGFPHHRKTAHLNFLSKDPHKLACSVMNPATAWGNAKEHISEELKKCSYEAEYTTECLNDVIARANREGFLVTLNHPVWSLQNYEDYIGLKGLWGLEVYNTGCALVGCPDTVQPLDDLLRVNENVFPLATDDAHSPTDHFGGYVMIKAQSLTYPEIMGALERGDFYSSTGAEIRSLYVDGNKLVVDCSPAHSVTVCTERRSNMYQTALYAGHITHAEFDLSGYFAGCAEELTGRRAYIRVVVTGADGGSAYTRAYGLKELKD